MKQTIEIDIELTPERMAVLFCEMDSEAQAQFFNAVARLSAQWAVPAFKQWDAMPEDLTKEGAALLRQMAASVEGEAGCAGTSEKGEHGNG